jgi:hypothetical protein
MGSQGPDGNQGPQGVLGSTLATSVQFLNEGYMFGGAKTTFASASAGWWIGQQGGVGKLSFGDATNFFKWDGTTMDIGGTSSSGDGAYLTSTGKFLKDTSLGTQYPTASDFTVDGRTHFYKWVGAAWVQQVCIGGSSTSPVESITNEQYTISVYGQNDYAGADAVYGYANANTGSGRGVVGVSDGDTGLGGYFACSGYGPIQLLPSASASAPAHTAPKGTLWVTSAGVLYINTNGSTTWGKVGAQ